MTIDSTHTPHAGDLVRRPLNPSRFREIVSRWRRKLEMSLDPSRLITSASRSALITLALIFPPAAVLVLKGIKLEQGVSLALTFLGYLPGQIHAMAVLLDTMCQDSPTPSGERTTTIRRLL